MFANGDRVQLASADAKEPMRTAYNTAFLHACKKEETFEVFIASLAYR